VWLNTRLSITYPAAVIPPFPTKRVVNNSDPEFLRARQAALENYLDKVARHPRMGTSLDLLVFLDANEAGLEAAKTYIEAVGEEEKASLLERASEAVGGLVSRGGVSLQLVWTHALLPSFPQLWSATQHSCAF